MSRAQLAIGFILLLAGRGWAGTVAACVSSAVDVSLSKSVTVLTDDRHPIRFAVEGRSAAERRFAQEQAQIDAAQGDELVPVEWLYHPFYEWDGHNSLRAGNAIYEFTRGGWRVHPGGKDSARAFIYNNPFFKKQYRKFSAAGVPPVSYGVSFLVKKSQLDAMVAGIGVDSKTAKNFSLLVRNCNQCMLKLATRAGVKELAQDPVTAFSSVLTFKKFLTDPPLPTNGTYLYPLPGVVTDGEADTSWVPRELYSKASPITDLATLVRRWHRLSRVEDAP
jgi:hypothetical protein